MGTCQNCIYFRSVKSKSQLLAQVIPSTDAQVSNALKEILKDENEQRGYEAQSKQEKSHNNDENWDMPPVMSNYCAFKQVEGNEAEKNTYLICEVKNIGERCTDFKEGRPAQQSCQTCASRVAAKGMAMDKAMEDRLSQAGQVNVVVGLSTSSTDDLLSKYRDGANSRKSFEILNAYNNQGHFVGSPPNYLDYCGALSQQENYVICTFQNPHSDCPRWRDSESNSVSQTSHTPDLSVLKPVAVAAVAAVAAIAAGFIFSGRSQKKRDTNESNEQELTEQETEQWIDAHSPELANALKKQNEQQALKVRMQDAERIHQVNMDIIKNFRA
jgi:hypothetical protein